MKNAGPDKKILTSNFLTIILVPTKMPKQLIESGLYQGVKAKVFTPSY
jgi:hypothetical protein